MLAGSPARQRAARQNGGHSLSTAMPKRRFLIVDDSDVIRRVLKHMLDKLGFDVAEAADGPSAIELCRVTMPDAVLLDWVMPGPSGIDALQMLRRLPGGHAPVVIYCPTEYIDVDVACARAAGANDVLLKPFTRVELVKTLTIAGLMA
jgi:two-component system, chemotaxis family, chemotaxis protein CheY